MTEKLKIMEGLKMKNKKIKLISLILGIVLFINSIPAVVINAIEQPT